MIEKNRKIAELAEWHVFEDRCDVVINGAKWGNFHLNEFRFHLDWNWIMSLYTHLAKTKTDFHFSVKHDVVKIKDRNYHVVASESNGVNLQEKMFFALMGYHRWYFEQRKYAIKEFTINRQEYISWYFESMDTDWISEKVKDEVYHTKVVFDFDDFTDGIDENDWKAIPIEATNEYDHEIHEGMTLGDVPGFELEILLD